VGVLNFVEEKVQINLGKGSGADTTEEEAEAIAQIIKSLNILEVNALDVGANIGNWTAAILRVLPDSKIVAFEPSAKAYLQLSERFRNSPRVECINKALGNKDSAAVLYADKSASGLGSLTKRRVDHFGIDFSFQEDIEIERLDSWIRSQPANFRPNILKMDVEGHELDVLKGGMNTLASAQVVQFEFGGCNIDTRTFFQDFWYLFTQAGFAIYRISAAGPIQITHYSEQDECYRTTNYLAVKK
jgi:FkbM family methyltransferase